MHYQFWLPLLVLAFCVIMFEKKYFMLRDLSNAAHKPYSWARVQLAWWSVIVLSSFIALLWKFGIAPDLNSDTLVLLGISAATIASARVIDVSEQTNESVTRNQDEPGQNFFLDILSDNNGVSIHRFQTLVFNLAFGCWFIHYVVTQLDAPPATAGLTPEQVKAAISPMIPTIGSNNLILLGLSSATYVALKSTENKTTQPATDAAAETVIDENPTPQLGQG